MRLDTFLAQAGVCARRKAKLLIEAGAVTVKGQAMLLPGYKISADDEVAYQGQRLQIEEKVYVLLNKPAGYITTRADEAGRKTVMELVAGATTTRIFPVGRLDRATTGLLLLTNDGVLAQKLAHPQGEVGKTYRVTLATPLTTKDELRLQQGVALEDGSVRLDQLMVKNPWRKRVTLTLHDGRNRVIRRLFSQLGYSVVNLDRLRYGLLTQQGLPKGGWRWLTPKEVAALYALSKLGKPCRGTA